MKEYLDLISLDLIGFVSEPIKRRYRSSPNRIEHFFQFLPEFLLMKIFVVASSEEIEELGKVNPELGAKRILLRW